MTTARHFALMLVLAFFALSGNGSAQTPAIEVSTDDDAAQFSTQGKAQSVRVEVYAPSGELVFEGDGFGGQRVEWQMRDQKGERVADGVYLATITVTDSLGKRRKRIEQITVSSERQPSAAAVAETSAPQESLAPTGAGTAGKIARWTTSTNLANSVITESVSKIGVNITPTATFQVNVSQPAPLFTNGVNAITLLQTSGGKGGNTTGTSGQQAGAGASISLAAGQGGDAPAGSQRGKGGNITLQPGSTGAGAGAAGASGNVLLAPSGVGNVGIGTPSPTSRLTVSGVIQTIGAGGGVKFPDNSVQTRAGLPVVQHNATLAGAGTAVSPLGVAVPLTLSGATNNAVLSVNNSGNFNGGGVAISGNGTNGSYGVQGSGFIGVNGLGGSSGTGVSGGSTGGGTGVFGRSSTGYAGHFEGKLRVTGIAAFDDRVGIGTTAPPSYAKLVIIGDGSTDQGVHSENSAGTGLYGFGQTGVEGFASAGGKGVSGIASNGNSNDKAVYGLTTLNGATGGYYGYAGYFVGNVKVFGKLEVAQGCVGCSPPSDRNLKANFSTVNPRFILDRLSTLPIQSWNYKSESDAVRHIGPMAQDFRAAFNLGADDKTLNTVDAQGVTMAAVQALYQLMLEKDEQVQRMMLEKDRQNQELSRKVEQLQEQLDQVRRTIRRRRAAKR